MQNCHNYKEVYLNGNRIILLETIDELFIDSDIELLSIENSQKYILKKQIGYVYHTRNIPKGDGSFF